MGEDEVLAARFADDARIGAIVGDVVADRLPHPLEDRGRAGEVDTGQVRARHDWVADLTSGPGDEVDDAGWEAGGLHELHQIPADENSRRRGFPQHGVPHQGRRGWQIAGNGGEVERCDGKDESFEGAVLDLVPVAEHGLGLLLVDKAHVVGVETPEVDELTGGVDLSLEDALRLIEHAGGVEAVAPRALQQLSGLENHRGAMLPRCLRPLPPCRGSGVDRHLDLGFAGLVVGAENVFVIVWADGFGSVTGSHLLAADDEGDLDLLAQHLLDRCLERGFLRRTGSVGLDRIVDRRWDGDDSIGHDGPPRG